MNKNKKYRYRLGSLLHCLSVSIEEIQRHCLIQMPNKIWDDTLGILRGASNQKTKNIYLLKFHFRRGMFYKELPNSQKKIPLGVPTLVTRKLGPTSKSALPQLFGSTCSGKRTGCSQGLPGGWLGRSTTHPKVTVDLKFHPNPFICLKVIHYLL